MNLTEWLDRQIPKLKWYDISLTKFSVLFAAFTLITVWPSFAAWVMSVAWYWHLLIMLLLAAPVFRKMFTD